MTDREKLVLFGEHMKEKGISEDVVNFNVHAVELLIDEVLYIFEQNLENIDTYSFEEFTDMVGVINEELGGREGIKKLLSAMQELTDFLKINKFIKGGKIAYYKRMFSNVDYYIDKYDMMMGKKDDSKNFIKNVLSNRFSSSVIKLVEDINIYDFETLKKIDKLLNDIPFGKREIDDGTNLIKSMLIDMKLIDEKNGQIETTKIGRAVSRLTVEERYGALMYLMFCDMDWNNVLAINGDRNIELDFEKLLNIMISVFSTKKEVVLNLDTIKKNDTESALIEISSERFRIARLEGMPYGTRIMDVCFEGMGMIDIRSNDNGDIIYKITDCGYGILKLLYNEYMWKMKNQIEGIGMLIKNKNFEMAETSILEYLSTFGHNIVVWNYLGQLLMLKRQYKYAYTVLKYAYEHSSKRGKTAKSILYYLVLCCRKLKLKDDVENYESKLQTMERA